MQMLEHVRQACCCRLRSWYQLKGVLRCTASPTCEKLMCSPSHCRWTQAPMDQRASLQETQAAPARPGQVHRQAAAVWQKSWRTSWSVLCAVTGWWPPTPLPPAATPSAGSAWQAGSRSTTPALAAGAKRLASLPQLLLAAPQPEHGPDNPAARWSGIRLRALLRRACCTTTMQRRAIFQLRPA